MNGKRTIFFIFLLQFILIHANNEKIELHDSYGELEIIRDSRAGITTSYHNQNHFPNRKYTIPIWPYSWDRNGDGIAWNKTLLTLTGCPELEYLSVNRNYFSMTKLANQTQRYGDNHYITLNTKDLEVGKSNRFQVKSCGEGYNHTFITAMCHGDPFIIPFPINLTTLEKVNGSSREIYLEWNVPSNEGCNIDYFNVLRNQVVIADTNYTDADIILPDIENTVFTITDTTGIGNLKFNYAIGGYESTGRLIALSGSQIPSVNDNTFSLISPSDDNILDDNSIIFSWESYNNWEYEIWLSDFSNFNNSIIISDIQDTIYTYSATLPNHNFVYWKIKAFSNSERDEVWSNETAWRFGINEINNNPSSFSLIYPVNNIICDTLRPVFLWEAAVDSGDNILYRIDIGFDTAFDSIASFDSLTQCTFIPAIDLPQNSNLYWKVTAFDSQGDSTLCSDGFQQFSCDKNDFPDKFSKIYPHREVSENANSGGWFNVEEISRQPEFKWHPSNDKDGGLISYEIWIDTSYVFSNPEIYSNIQDTTWTYPTLLEENETYYWDVFAKDSDGDMSKSYGYNWIFVVNEANEPPYPFIISDPVGIQDSVNLTFYWQQNIDPDPNSLVGYDMWLSQDSTFSSLYVKDGISPGSQYTFAYIEPQWHVSDNNSYSGNSWWCGDDNLSTYKNNWVQSLCSSEIDLTSLNGATVLSFIHSYVTEGPNWDGGVVRIRSNINDNWQVIYPTMGNYDIASLYAFTYHGYDTTPAFCGNSNGWVNAEFDLSIYNGEIIQIEFLFASDEFEYDFNGWHIDNIEITNNGNILLRDDGYDTNRGFEGFSSNIRRGETYFCKIKAIDRYNVNYVSELDYIFSNILNFNVKQYPSLSGHAFLEDQTEHSGIEVCLTAISPVAISDTIYTDQNGYYAAPEVYPGTYNITFHKDGFEDPLGFDNVYIFPTEVIMDNKILNHTFSCPENVKIFAGDSIAIMSWDSLSTSNLTGFNVYRKLTTQPDFELLAQLDWDIVTFIDTTIFNDISYDYTVRAHYFNTFESGNSQVISTMGWYAGPICYVATDGSHVYGNGSQTSPLSSIQRAIYCVRSSDQIIVNPGIYYENINFTGKNIKLFSLFHTTQDTSFISQTIIDGNQSGSVITIMSGEDSTAVVSGLTIQNGNAYNGAGIYCSNSNPIFAYLIIRNNIASHYGGGIYNSNGSQLFESIKFLNNTARTGAGCYGGTNVYNCEFVNNTASLTGGGLYGAIHVSNCLFLYNTADDGPGLYIGNSLVEKCIFANNSTTGWEAGCIAIGSGSPVINKVTITKTQVGFGVFLRWQSFATPIIINCNIWDNYRGSTYASWNSGGSYTITYSNGFTDSTNINEDPLFVDGESDNYELQWASPCIDSGNPDTQYNDPDGTVADMGAYFFDQNIPHADFSCDSQMGAPPLMVNFSDQSVGTYNHWEWDFQNDGIVDSNEENPQFTFDDLGSYSVELKLTNSNGASDSICFNNFISVLNQYGIWDTTYSPCYIYGDINIPDGQTLTIEPGVEIKFMGNYKLNVQGSLLAEGTLEDSIQFTTEGHDNGWHGIRFDNTPASNDSSKFSYCVFENGKDDQSTNGGAIHISNFSKIHISNSTFRNNRTNFLGGAIYLDHADIQIKNSKFVNNDALRGGAIYSVWSDAIIENNVIANNSTGQSASGVYLVQANDLQFNNNTITNNKGDNAALIIASTNYIVLSNCIIWGNKDNNNNISTVFLSNANAVFTYNNIEDGWVGIGNINLSPLFINPSAGAGNSYEGDIADWSLQENSPCIDAGNPDSQYNDPDGTRNDMGAYYFHQIIVPGSPQNVTIEIIGSDIHISWDTVIGANSYQVYSSDNPYIGFVKDTSGSFAGETWNTQITYMKKFYYVIASTEIEDNILNKSNIKGK